MPLDTRQCEVLVEMMNIAAGRAAAALADLTQERVKLSIPRVVSCTTRQLRERFGVAARSFGALVFQDFTGLVEGRAVLALGEESRDRCAELLAGFAHAGPLMDRGGILVEFGNIVLNSVLGTLGNLADIWLECGIPELSPLNDLVAVIGDRHSGQGPAANEFLVADVRFRISERDIIGSIVILFEVGGIHILVQPMAAG